MRFSWLLAATALVACSENPRKDAAAETLAAAAGDAVAASDAAKFAAAVESVEASPGPAPCGPAADGGGLNVLGVRLGMDPASARRILECQGFEIRTHTLSNILVVKTTSPRDFEKVDLRVSGVPGRQQVVGILRHATYFQAGTEPSVDAVRRSLLEKYGPLEPLYHGGRGQPILQGVRLSEYNDEPYMITAEQDCASDVASGGGSLYHPQPQCGELVAIYISPKQSNQGLVEKLTVEVTNGIMAARLDEEYRRFAEREQASAAQRAVSDAASRTPDL